MKKSLLVFVLSVVATVMAMAQITTSALGGKVTDDMGEVVGATIQAVHNPSGTHYGTISNANGTYNIQGMRVGGPYTVKISYVGYATQVFEDVYLALGETYNITAELKTNSDMLEEVVVMGTASKFNNLKTGASTSISMAQIAAVPTVNRSVTDIVRLSPYSNGMGLAGGDGRSTNFTVDGANFNNNFGLSANLPGGGTPISVEALQEMQVVVSPFDVRQTNFVGGGINAVTKSGTNTFQGSAYMYQQNDNMGGSRVNNKSFDVDRLNDKHVFGATFGGPLIKDKLFFFVNVEKTLEPKSQTQWRPSEDGVANVSKNLSATSVADMKTVSDFVNSNFGYSTGGWSNYSNDNENLKILVKLDWNINDNHRLSLRYNKTDNTTWYETNGSSSNASSRATKNRISQYSMAFANSLYFQKNNVNSWSLDLNSRFGDNMQNQLIATYTDIDDKRGTNSSEFPFIDILDGTIDATGAASPYMALGYELFTYNNGVGNRTVTVNDNFTYYLADHKLLAGLSYEHQYANNAYMRNGTGYYRYKSLNDFLTGATPETVALTYGYNGEQNPNAQVTFNQFGLYLQDEWQVLKNLKLTYGARFDILVFDEKDIMTNNAIKELDYNGKSIDTGKWPGAHLMPSPRVGFNWDVLKDQSLIVRGGTGLFTGRLPLVFFTNMPTNSGMIQNVAAISTKWKVNDDQTISSTPDPLLANFAGGMLVKKGDILAKLNSLDPTRFPLNITPEDGTVPSEINGIDPDFKMPMVWKTSIGVDYSFPVDFPLTLSAEYTYSDNIYAVMLDNYNIDNSKITGADRFSGADNRYIYPADYKINPSGKTANAFVLTNTRKGYGYTANVTLKSRPLPNLDLMASYTHTVSKAVSGMPGSNAASAWTNLYTVNGPNLASTQCTQYVTPDRLIASLGWTVPQHKDGWATHYTLFYEGATPAGYSYILANDMNGDGNSYDLMYIPKSMDEVKFVDNGSISAETQAKDFWAFVNHDKYLSKHKGEYAEAFAARAPWMSVFDFRIAQDFGIRTPNKNLHMLTVSLDFSNIGNMFNSNWGSPKTTLLNSGKFLTYKGKDTTTGQPLYTLYYDKNGNAPYDVWSYTSSIQNTWKVQLGIRYTFN